VERGGSLKKIEISQMRTNNFIICFLFASISVLGGSNSYAKVETVIGGIPMASNINLSAIVPTSSDSEIIISRDQYVISYNKTRRAPNWVAWKLTAKQIGDSGRTNNFRADPDLENYLVQSGGGFHAVDPREYTSSCFDRGHQVPSDDRTDNTSDNDATFVMSNMVPQTAYLNRVVWEHLEQYTRDMVQKDGKEVYVIAGPIYDQDFGAIGPNRDIPVPSKDFKIIVTIDSKKKPGQNVTVIAVVMPNLLQNGKKPVPYAKDCTAGLMNTASGGRDDWQQYKTSVSNIESLSKLTIAIPGN
jgi:DNA/RNA endonuclease G (NUC1)